MARQWLIAFSVLSLALWGGEAVADTMERDSLQMTSLFQVHNTERRLARPKGESARDKRVESLFEDDEDLSLFVDYHPTVDRWTERNNRIRVAVPVSLWLYSGELDVRPNAAVGVSVSWEAPGFISILFEGAISPYSRLEVKPGASLNPQSSRHADGFTGNLYLSIAIFNPELSNENLALWAGVGGGCWLFSFDEDSVQNSFAPSDVEFNEVVPAAKVFFDIDYKITDVFHVGFGFATHVLYAEFTDDGRFYEVNNVDGGVGLGGALTQEGRNDGFVGHLAVIWDIHLSFSVVF